MICDKCQCKDECGWYGSLEKIKNEIIFGIGMNNQLGKNLMETINDYDLYVCEYFEEQET